MSDETEREAEDGRTDDHERPTTHTERPTVIEPSGAPTLIDDEVDDTTSREVPVLSHLRDQIEDDEDAPPSVEPTGPRTLVEPSSASSRVSGDYQDEARRLREQWDEAGDGYDAEVAEQLGASFAPERYGADEPCPPKKVPRPEPPPEIDASVLREEAERRRTRAAAEEPAPPSDFGDDGEPDADADADAESEESLEEKKEKMRQYMAADRELTSWRNSRRRGKFSSLGCFARVVLAIFLLAGLVGLIWVWHPWSTEIETFDAKEYPGICSPGVDGQRTVEYTTIFGVRVSKSGESTVCVE